MGILDEINRHCIVNREIKKEGIYAFITHQRRMSDIKRNLRNIGEEMLKENLSSISLEPIYDTVFGEKLENILRNENGVFQKIDHMSGCSCRKEYNMLFNNGQFIRTCMESEEFKSIILQDQYGIYRELYSFPKKIRHNVMHEIKEVIKEMPGKANLPNE